MIQQKIALYGLTNSNRDFSSPYAWGKNQFNSSFPAALACYMRDQKIPSVFIQHDQQSNTRLSDISFDDFWRTTLPNEKLFFSFEYRFTPYAEMTVDDIQPIDLDDIIEALDVFLNIYSKHERPFLMQPIWKTKGKSPILADNCLDIFVWSDFALCRLLLESGNSHDEKISRPQRAALRLARFLYELSTKGKVYQKPIYDGMTFDTLNDKEFAVSGKKTNLHMR